MVEATLTGILGMTCLCFILSRFFLDLKSNLDGIIAFLGLAFLL